MIWLLPGAVSFVFFIWFDSRKSRRRNGAAVFAAGCCLLLASAGGLAADALREERNGPGRIIAGALMALFAAALVYTLFFALPAGTTYGRGGETELVRAGVYARCRHPGFWPFLGGALCLGVFCSTAAGWIGAAVFSLLDLGYILLQDRLFFPRYIRGYDAYKREVPFLIPARRRGR